MPRSTSTDRRLPAVILAAGGSRRFSMGNKLLAPIGERPLLAHVVSACLDAHRLSHVYVVLGHEAERVEAVLNEDVSSYHVTVLVNNRWSDGLSTSLHTAIRALPDDEPGVLILPGDMPFMTAELIDRVAETSLRTDRICFPVVDHRKGHPTAFPRRTFDHLRHTDGDVGARDIVGTYWDAAIKIGLEADEAHTQTDIDTPADRDRVASAHLHLDNDATSPGGCHAHDPKDYGSTA